MTPRQPVREIACRLGEWASKCTHCCVHCVHARNSYARAHARKYGGTGHAPAAGGKRTSVDADAQGRARKGVHARTNVRACAVSSAAGVHARGNGEDTQGVRAQAQTQIRNGVHARRYGGTRAGGAGTEARNQELGPHAQTQMRKGAHARAGMEARRQEGSVDADAQGRARRGVHARTNVRACAVSAGASSPSPPPLGWDPPPRGA